MASTNLMISKCCIIRLLYFYSIPVKKEAQSAIPFVLSFFFLSEQKFEVYSGKKKSGR